MREHPIIFNSEMVKAILDGRKSQTRRTKGLEIVNRNNDTWEYNLTLNGLAQFINRTRGSVEYIKCPYGHPGDRLWVKETFYKLYGTVAWAPIYKADDNFDFSKQSQPKKYKWTSSRFMPRWASRITLEITDIRVERVQEISEEDAKAEGIRSHDIQIGKHFNPQPEYVAFPKKEGGFQRATEAFEALWDSLNAKRGYSWESNPWVWIISFKEYKETP